MTVIAMSRTEIDRGESAGHPTIACMAMRWPAPIDNGPRNRCPSRCSCTFFRGAAGFHKLIMTFSRSGLSFHYELYPPN